jgi:DNA/RNA-binding domain of Phe-tRNA-synthetase-like protein
VNNKAEKGSKVAMSIEARALLQVAEILDGMTKEQAHKVLAMTCIIFEKYDEAIATVQFLMDGQTDPQLEPSLSGDDA